MPAALRSNEGHDTGRSNKSHDRPTERNDIDRISSVISLLRTVRADTKEKAAGIPGGPG